ncbi:MAG: cobalamin B12-binding domain-containing protein [Nitrospinae bacterium]|nr:cobalamin B12-binding domain-containing protein [Nitrospinota bacterium]
MSVVERILLVNPPWDPAIGYGKSLAKMTFLFPPIGLMYLASYVEREKNVQVRIFDSQVEDRELFQEISVFQPEIVGITSQTAQYPMTTHLAKEIKDKFPQITVIVGGSHPSVLPWEVASNPYIDITVIGEGEATLSEIIGWENGEISIKDIKGIAYRDKSGVVLTPDRPLIPDLDNLPMPAAKLIDLTKYRCSPDNQIGNKTAVITTSRGCPFNCTFCAIKDKYSNRYRIRSMESIETELDYYKENGIDSLFIMDDIFTLNKKAVYSFCNLLNEKKYKFNWWAQTRADCIDPEMLEVMKKAGCSILSFGIESGSDRILKLIKKQITKEQIRKAVTMARKAGIRTRGSFILGLTEETLFESIKTIGFALRLPLHRAKFGLLVPYPGTEVWDLALREGQVKENGEDWERFSPMWGYSNLPPSYVPRGRNPKVLRLMQKFANFVFYLKPDVIWDITSYYYRNNKWADLFFAIRTFVRATFSRSR